MEGPAIHPARGMARNVAWLGEVAWLWVVAWRAAHICGAARPRRAVPDIPHRGDGCVAAQSYEEAGENTTQRERSAGLCRTKKRTPAHRLALLRPEKAAEGLDMWKSQHRVDFSKAL